MYTSKMRHWKPNSGYYLASCDVMIMKTIHNTYPGNSNFKPYLVFSDNYNIPGCHEKQEILATRKL